MAIQCTHCGINLKDEARFCNVCGTLVPSHPFSAKSSMSPSSPARQADSTIIRKGMREQIAQQPPARPVRPMTQDEPPSWMGQLISEVHPRTPSDGFKHDRQDSPPPFAQVDALPKQRAFKSTPEIQPDTFEQDEKTQIVSPSRESGRKQNQSASQHTQNSHTPSVQQQIHEDDVEDLPTRPLVAEAPTKVTSQSDTHTPRTTSTPAALPTPPPGTTPSKAQKISPAPGDVDQLDTVPMATPMSVKPHIPSRPIAEPVRPQRQPGQQLGQQPNSFSDLIATRPQSPISQPSYQHATDSVVPDHLTMIPVAPIPATPTPDKRKASPSMAPPMQPPKRRRSRRSLAMILGILLLLLVGGGIGTWIVLEQPFSVAGVTQPQQTFSNAQIGVSLSYPNGWATKVDAHETTVFLSDSSQTAQFKIISGPTNGGDVGKYLQQVASQQNMTSLKAMTTQSFAATSWQQLQGSVLLNGASYTETLFATVHRQHLYTILQLAPQSTYSQEEQYVFSGMRSSFQFIA